MRTASGHQCKVKMSGNEKKVNEKTYYISSIKRVTKTSLEVSRCSRAKQRSEEMYKKSVQHVQSCFFANFNVVFTVLRRCLRRLALHDFIFCLKKL